jgi:hypothetical protein
MNDRELVLVISGAMGAGKSTVMEAVGDLLVERGIPSSMIDLDFLGQVYPPPPDDPVLNGLIVEGLAALWPSFRRREVRLLVAARLIRSAEIWENYKRSIPEADWTLVRVTAPREVIEARLVKRHELDISPRVFERHRQWSLEVTRDLDERNFEDFTVLNEGPLRPIAEQILDKWPNVST